MPKFDPQHGLSTIAIQAEEAENPNPGFLYHFAVMIAVESTTPLNPLKQKNAWQPARSSFLAAKIFCFRAV
ncbi:MAG: hypothetical protein MUO62_16680 [Anaerolineales bacterium]|nr:hypothetical protein [Anaerolineales bacterium]